MVISIKQNIIKSGVVVLGFFLFVGLYSCEKDPAVKAKEIVSSSVQAHGGLDKWQSMRELSFTKTTTLFLEDGSIESKVTQKQSFTFKPNQIFKIGYKQDSLIISLISDNGYIHKRVNGYVEDDKNEVEKAGNAIKAAHYVVSQPFALLGKDATITWAGTEEVEGKKYEVIKVAYSSDGPDADKWSYYIDPKTNRVMANKVELTDHTSWVENLTFDETSDFVFNAHRKSYRLNEKGEKTYLRAEYFYEDYKIRY